MDARDSLQLIELDKGGEQLGLLFEEPRRRLREEHEFRGAWSQYQAIRALAWEMAPELEERLVRQGLQSARRHEVERRLARATGSQDAAREILLAPGGAKRGLPVWASFLLLLAAIGLGWTAFGPATKSQESAAPSFAPADGANPKAGDDSMPFEFPPEGAARQDEAVGKPPASDETRAENADARQARRLLQAHLHRNDAPAPTAEPRAPLQAPTTVPTPAISIATETVAPAPAAAALPTSVPTHLPTLRPTPVPTAVPTAVPTRVPTAVPTALPTAAPTRVSSIELLPEESPAAAVAPKPRPAPSVAAGSAKTSTPRKLEGMAVDAELTLSGDHFPAQATLSLPEAGAVDLRLFDMRGRLVRRYAEGEQGAGRWRYNLSATDEQGQPLAKGSYYLRVITRWFSKVEALEQP